MAISANGDDTGSIFAGTEDPVRLRSLANQALVDIFSALEGNRWRNRDGWLTPGTDVKRWHGVIVEAGKLVSLNLISNDLKGAIPSTINNLATLKELNMSYNFGLVGALPMEVGSMVNLTVLHIYCAGIHGPIPESLSQLHRLEELWLNGNRLNGSIPDGLGLLSHLRELYLNANELAGSIPSSFSNLTNLEGLNVSWNHLSGGFPPCLGGMVSLRLLVLEGNDDLEDRPPVSHGTELLEWLTSKRAAVACGYQPGLDLSDLHGEPEGMFSTLEAQGQHGSSKRHCAGNPSALDNVVPKGPCSEEKRQLVATYVNSETSPSLQVGQDVLEGETEPPFHLEALRTFTASHLMEENIDFLLEVDKFKLSEEIHLQEAATAIFKRFVTPGAPMEINLSGTVRAATLTKMQRLQSQESCQFCRDIFDQAHQQIFDLINADAFPRFVQYTNSQV